MSVDILFRKRLEQQITAALATTEEQMLAGVPRDMSEYRYLVGRHKALTDVLAMNEEVWKELVGGNEQRT